MAAGLLSVGTVVMCCGLCDQWLARADEEKGLSSLKSNDEWRHHCHSSFGCHVTLSNMAPGKPPHPSPSVVTWCWWSFCDCCGCRRQMQVAAIGNGDDGGGGEMRVAVA